MFALDKKNNLKLNDSNFLINQFKERARELNISAQINLLQEIQEFITNNPIKTYHPQDIYPLHCHVVKLSSFVYHSKDSKLIDTWKKVLDILNGQKYTIQKSEASESFENKQFDCAPALQLFATGVFAQPVIYRLQGKNISQTELNAIVELDQEGYGTTHPKSYYETLLQAPETLCLIAVLQEKIIACAWGSICTTTKDLRLHSLTRKANLPGFSLSERFYQAIKGNELFNTISFTVSQKNSGAQRICRELFSIDILNSPQSKKISLIHSLPERTTKIIPCHPQRKFLTSSLSKIDGENFHHEEFEESKQTKSLPSSKETTPTFMSKTYKFFTSFSLTDILSKKSN